MANRVGCGKLIELVYSDGNASIFAITCGDNNELCEECALKQNGETKDGE